MTQLYVYLPNGQRVLFTVQTAATQAETPPKTTLTAFFALCETYNLTDPTTADYAFVRILHYIDAPQYFTFNKRTISRQPRKQGQPVWCDNRLTSFKKAKNIGRIYTIHPKQRECFFLRILLTHRSAPTSFQNLRTVSESILPTFHNACLRLELLQTNHHWVATMREAPLSASPNALRYLFAVLLAFCDVADRAALWTQFRTYLTEDIRHRH